MKNNLEIQFLKTRIEQLENENERLKELLQNAGISYDVSDRSPKEIVITETLAKHFYARFWGRTDVHAKRFINKKTGEAGYSPQCDYFWRDGICPRRHGQRIRCIDCKHRKWTKLTSRQIIAHLQGLKEDGSDVIGVYPLHPDNTCRFLVFDFDNHEKVKGKGSFSNEADDWKEEVTTVHAICKLNGIDSLIERSRSGNGAHLWILFEEPIDAGLARKFGFALLEKGAESVNMKSFKYYDRIIPAQDSIDDNRLGNLIALPLQGQALKRGNSAFVDENWQMYEDQWERLFSIKRLSASFLTECIKKWQGDLQQEDTGEKIKPWEFISEFSRTDVDGDLRIVLSNLIYIDSGNLKARLQNQIRRLAAFRNPVFSKNLAMGLSNYADSRYVYLGQDENGYIGIPRGLSEILAKKCDKSGISYCIEDKRIDGRTIDVGFKGVLRENQKNAVEALTAFDTGILSAATAFGKTVVCCSLIAQKKVNTLILLESSSLVEQWENAVERFLEVCEEIPEYVTPSGRVKRRKSVIGKIQGAHDSSTGIIDIAMVGSLYKKGEFHERLQQYGMILIDECHHAASETIDRVLREVKAKYVYGVTATLARGDGLEKATLMSIGPVRYRFSSKERAVEQNIAHLVYPRFTRAACPRSQVQHISDAYAFIRNHDMRNQQIVTDIKYCIECERTPIVLTRFKEHANLLFELLQNVAQHVILMTGDNSKKKHKEVLNQLMQVPKNETLILIATGQLVGEGFDYPRLDTLVLATPISGAQVVEQYAGRLNRDYDGKKDVIIYDYVDSHISKFDKMYAKRLRAYKSIGYSVCLGALGEKQAANAIFDFETYEKPYEEDLLEARKRVIISSPKMSERKVSRMIDLLEDVQIRGVRITILTWNPDTYKYANSSFAISLLERLREVGFEILLMEEFCTHFSIIDDEIVWYGNLNFLAKADMEDTAMRIVDKEVAAELMEFSFSDSQSLTEW